MNFLVRTVEFCAQSFPFTFLFAIIIKLYAKVRINLTACYIVHEIQNEMPIEDEEKVSVKRKLFSSLSQTLNLAEKKA